MSSRSWPVSLILGIGLVFLYAGERIVESGTSRAVMSGLGAVIVLFAAGLRFIRSRQASADRSTVESWLLYLQLGVVGSLLLYLLQSDLWAKIAGETLQTHSPKLAGSLAALWPAVLAVTALPLVLMEFAYASMERAPKVELGRMREAMYSGLGLGFGLVFALAFQYVASERDAKADFSYFRTSKPGDATRKLVASLDEPLKVSMFFPPANDVGDEVRSYFDDLKKESTRLEVEDLDQPLEPVKSKELGVSGNGTVVISKGGRKESLNIGTDLEKSRTNLKGLDADVQKKLLLVAKSKRTIYLTAGHGERTEDPLNTTDQRATISLLRNELKSQNFELKKLSAAEGLGSEIPKDAAAVLVLGPQQDFDSAEAKVLEDYENKGGKVLIAVDPEAGSDFKDLLSPLAVKFNPTVLANDAVFIRSTHGPSDRTILATSSYSSHPVASSVGRQNLPTVFYTSGSLEELPQHNANTVVDFTVRAHAQTWDDLNNNFQADTPPEVRKAYGLVTSITRRAPSNKIEEELRAVVMADSDALGDIVLSQIKPNQGLVLDMLKWLVGEEKIMGLTNSEADVAIVRTRQQDMVWFYATIFLAPAVVIIAGFFMRRRKPKTPAVSAPPSKPKEATS
jgi:hypothetical protein